MDLHPARLALLRAIAAAPDDDAPRLVYADWLDEHGPGDADRARAEFVRLACGLKPKVQITRAEQLWLADNWRRLVPTLAGRLAELGAKPDHQWTGRILRLWHFRRLSLGGTIKLELEFWRGFVQRAVYLVGFGETAGAVAADEPLARHEIGPVLPNPYRLADGRFRIGVTPGACFGRDVWDRLTGYAQPGTDPVTPTKQFDQPDTGPLARRQLLDQVHAAVCAAMTAEARHRAGWPEDFPVLGR